LGRLPILSLALLIPLTLCSGPTGLRADGPVLSELMAGKQRVLVDEDGDFPDWLEIYNPGSSPVSLSGFFLTDSVQDLTRWRFPDITLGAGRFLVVFASEKDRRDPAAPLHTSFRLKRSGDYLALVAPDGATIVSRFDPRYPEQVEGSSYGLAMEGSSTVLVTAGAPARILVPAGTSLAQSWTQSGFDDASWLQGPLPAGYDKKSPATLRALIQTDLAASLQSKNATAYLRVHFTAGDPAAWNNLLLRMRYDDGFIAYLNGQEVARRNAPAAAVWNSQAAVVRPEDQSLLLESIDISSALPLLRPGDNVLAIQGLNAASSDADFLIAPELEAAAAGAVHPDPSLYFPVPTPGMPNGAGVSAVAESPLFSLPGGGYPAPISLTLSVASPGKVIRYTLDGSPPSSSSRIYSAPISISVTTVVRARTYAADSIPSPILTQTYLLLDPSVKDFSSNLPLVVINAFGKSIAEDPRTPVYVQVVDAIDGRSSIATVPDFQGSAGIKIRGSSSLQFPKKSYSLETWDEDRDDQAVELLGFPQESDWILYAPYTDKTLMRDVLAYDWSNLIGRYAVRTRFVEVFLSGATGKLTAADYLGVYVFEEKIKRGKNRVDVKRLYASQTTAPATSGGYILKIDRLDPGDQGLTTSAGTLLAHVYPKEEEITFAQKSYLKGYLDQFETALAGVNFKNPTLGYPKYIDAGSFIDHHMLVELTKNIDGFRLSTFMFKDNQGKLNMGPIWDYNLTLGNANYLDGWKPEGWYLSEISIAWWPRLFQDPAFVKLWSDRWLALRQDQFKTSVLLGRIDDYARLLQESQARNYQRWPILGTYVWPNQFIGKTYQEEIDFMKGWLQGRVAWIDGQYVAAPSFNQDGGAISAGFQLSIAASAGTIYYTLDGSDPRLPDETVSPSALSYSAPITLNANTRVRARVKLLASWSALKEGLFIVAIPTLAITEIMYRPAPPPPASGYLADDFEFLELQNIGKSSLALKGIRLQTGLVFDFTASAIQSLAPGGYLVVVKNPTAFRTRYGSASIPVAGQYTGDLNDHSDILELVGGAGEPILKFSYRSLWYPPTDGNGYSLTIVDPSTPTSKLSVKESWKPSGQPGGSPGGPDQPPGGLQRPSDGNQDGKLDISDGSQLLGFLFLGTAGRLPCGDGTIEEPGNLQLLDSNGDGHVDLADAIRLFGFLFLGEAPPVLGEACVRIPGCPDGPAGCAP
jgi:hypothetical protein